MVAAEPAERGAERRRLISPLMRRILLVNALPLVLLLATLLYLDQYQSGLLAAKVTALREQARIYAGALAESGVRMAGAAGPVLDPGLARPLLYRLTAPTPNAQARVYGPGGQLIADSRVRAGPGGVVVSEPLPPVATPGPLMGTVTWIYDNLFSLLPQNNAIPAESAASPQAGLDWQPDLRQALAMTTGSKAHEMAPFIRRTADGHLLVTVAEPVVRERKVVGIVLLTRDANEIDRALFAVRISILGLFSLAMVLTVLLSWYLSRTIASPLLALANAAGELHEGRGRAGAVPERLLVREDEIGVLARALARSAAALWARLDAIERFAAEVAHEIKNPLSSIRSAIETLARIEDGSQRTRLLGIIAQDVVRLDRLISDISESSRLDAELSRVQPERVDLAPIIAALAEIHDATRREGEPRLAVEAPREGLPVRAVEGRLVQVLRNLIANAISFSPADGRILLHARETGSVVEIAVEDEGPGIPEGKLEHVFDRFYSERPAGEGFGQHSGLGLSISRQIVEAARGRISAENRRGAGGAVIGARFIVRLPRA
ncbi:MAG: stimulus-sensing domain-containing protein [Acetobacteraceae bacterium]